MNPLFGHEVETDSTSQLNVPLPLKQSFLLLIHKKAATETGGLGCCCLEDINLPLKQINKGFNIQHAFFLLQFITAVFNVLIFDK